MTEEYIENIKIFRFRHSRELSQGQGKAKTFVGSGVANWRKVCLEAALRQGNCLGLYHCKSQLLVSHIKNW
jgi:hypothetical protein